MSFEVPSVTMKSSHWEVPTDRAVLPGTFQLLRGSAVCFQLPSTLLPVSAVPVQPVLKARLQVSKHSSAEHLLWLPSCGTGLALGFVLQLLAHPLTSLLQLVQAFLFFPLTASHDTGP